MDEQIWKTGHVFFYLADEEGNALSIKAREGPVSKDHSLLVSGSRQDVGGWELHLNSLVRLSSDVWDASNWYWNSIKS